MERDIVVIGASAGGVTALRQLVSGFPPGWDAAVFVAMHLPAAGTSFLPRLLSQAGPLTVKHPMDGEKISPGIICVAPPGSHMVLDDDRVSLVHDSRQNHYCPSVDTLFRSAADAFGSRVVGAVLTGNLGDGSLGLSAIHRRGGTTIVQDPSDARFPAMPFHALQTGDADYCVRLVEIAPLMVKLTTAGVESWSGGGLGVGRGCGTIWANGPWTTARALTQNTCLPGTGGREWRGPWNAITRR
jgi:two-component system chemotaxis response regulator CheB